MINACSLHVDTLSTSYETLHAHLVPSTWTHYRHRTRYFMHTLFPPRGHTIDIVRDTSCTQRCCLYVLYVFVSCFEKSPFAENFKHCLLTSFILKYYMFLSRYFPLLTRAGPSAPDRKIGGKVSFLHLIFCADSYVVRSTPFLPQLST